MRNLKDVFLFIATALILSCKEEYNPQVSETQTTYLVIEGMLINGGPTSIHLSRTRPLNQGQEKPELKAIVSIESDANQKFLLTEIPQGEYITQLILNTSQKYRLHIKTSDGKEYLSDFVSVMSSPPIDKLTWEKNSQGIEIYVDTHNPQNNTRYYRWGYEETWITNAAYVSKFEYVNKVIRPRAVPAHRVCYDTETGNLLALASTAKLTDDVVYHAKAHSLPLYSSKLKEKYSILIKQYALEQKAYEYWQAMKKNTEQLGSIFDPQPSYTYGNISSLSNPKEFVIGYFGASNVTEKRIFITAIEAIWYIPTIVYDPPDFPDPCTIYTVLKSQAALDQAFGKNPGQKGWTPVDEVFDMGGNLIGYSAVEQSYCADCGPNYVKPVWWQ